MFESRRDGDALGLSIVARFGLGGRDVANGFEEAPVVQPVNPFQGDEFDGLQGAPWSAAPDHLGLVEAVDRELCGKLGDDGLKRAAYRGR